MKIKRKGRNEREGFAKKTQKYLCESFAIVALFAFKKNYEFKTANIVAAWVK